MSSGPIADSGRPPCPVFTVQSLILNTEAGAAQRRVSDILADAQGSGSLWSGKNSVCTHGPSHSMIQSYLPVVRRAPFYVLVRPPGRREGQVTLHVARVQGLLPAPRNQPGPALTSYPIPNDPLASGRTVQLCDLGSVTYPVVTLRAMLGWGLGLGLKIMGIHGRI